MLSALIAFLFGAFEAFVLSRLLLSATSCNYKKMAVFFAVKFISYAGAFFLLFYFFSQYILNCIIGYSVGLPVVTVIWFIFNALQNKKAESGDDRNENNNNN